MDPHAPPAHGSAHPLALGSKAAAERLGISERLLWTLSRSGEIPHVRIGKRKLYRVTDLEQFLEDRLARPSRRARA